MEVLGGSKNCDSSKISKNSETERQKKMVTVQKKDLRGNGCGGIGGGGAKMATVLNFPRILKLGGQKVATVLKKTHKTKEGETNCFGNICNFEKGHFDPHINGGIEISGNQCKWCNSFYKDKITWDYSTGKPTFNSYAIIRDAPKLEIIKQLKKLGFTSEDLI